MKKLISCVVVLLSACGGASKANLEFGADHFYSRTMAATVPDLHGTYTVTGSFAGSPSDGAVLVVEQGFPGATKNSPNLKLSRKTSDGVLQATGLGTIVGDQVYVAWELAAARTLAGPTMVELYVLDLKPASFEGFVNSSMNSPFSGSYGGATPPGKLGVGAEATYPFTQQDYGKPDLHHQLMLRRYSDQVYTHVVAGGDSLTGTSMFVGNARLVAAILDEVQTDVPQIAIGVYTIAQGKLSGRSAFMDNENEAKPPHGGRAGTLRLPPTTEEWLCTTCGDAK